MAQTTNRYTGPRKWNWGTIILVVIAHLLVGLGLIRAFAPDFTAAAVEQVESVFTVDITAPEPTQSPTPAPQPTRAPREAGDEGAKGREATPREIVAPAPRIPQPDPPPAPRASSTGRANQSGGSADGSGTGSGDSGTGTGAGGEGSGPGGGGGGGGIATRPSVRSGSIDSARDYAVPAGGREVRFGTEVVVIFTVGTNGRASNCRVYRPGPDPATNARTCELVVDRIRFNPATDSNGDPLPAQFAWRQTFSAR